MSKHSYALGSRRRWLEMFLLFIAPLLIAYVLLCVPFYDIWANWMAFVSAAPMFVFVLVLHGRFRWVSEIAENLAYGAATEDGIRFRKWFRYRFVAWRAIERLEYWPERGGRIDLHLYSEPAPITFIPECPPEQALGTQANGVSAVEFISRKLGEAWPGNSTFVISYEAAPSKQPGFFTARMARLTVRQRALANALFMLMGLVLSFHAMGAIWRAVGSLWAHLIVLLSALTLALAAWAWDLLSGKAGSRRESKGRLLEKTNPGTREKDG